MATWVFICCFRCGPDRAEVQASRENFDLEAKGLPFSDVVEAHAPARLSAAGHRRRCRMLASAQRIVQSDRAGADWWHLRIGKRIRESRPGLGARAVAGKAKASSIDFVARGGGIRAESLSPHRRFVTWAKPWPVQPNP